MAEISDRTIVLAGTACRYPDADTPAQLLANVLEKRQSFRSVPESRLDLSGYGANVIGGDDSITPILAGLLADWRFDPAKFRIPKDTFASTDLVHWLALEVADNAVAACGGIANFPLDRTGVVVANTLTGEFSRTSQLRLRWPWLDRQLAGAIEANEIDPPTAAKLRAAFRERIYAAFPAPDEETLAGGLANTIAGRIANYFDLHAGAWLVDAACASSLVALANAAEHISCGRADAMIVVGVDLSLDPFELVGFSRTGALTARRMRVFDRRADGFWPGEGAGAVVLGTRRWAEESGLDAQVELAGWGLSSDGSGGLTRPEATGQLRALREAYTRFALDPADLGFIEAHGTGTAVGDPAEIEALARLLDGDATGRRIPVGSVKGNIGHAKAAAGMAGFIKTAESLQNGLVPPHAGCSDPNPIFAETGHRFAVATEACELAERSKPWLAGVSSFGFGGINAHAVLRATPGEAPVLPPMRVWGEDELFVFASEDAGGMSRSLEDLLSRARHASVSEVRDLAASCAGRLSQGALRLAFVAGRPDELCRKIEQAMQALPDREVPGIWVGRPLTAPRIGLLFPGQGAPCRAEVGGWGERFGIEPSGFVPEGDTQHTRNAQPIIVGSEIAGLELLGMVGVEGEIALGHSLGELTALHWAGVFDHEAAMRVAAARGAAMGALPGGAMLHLSCDAETAAHLVDGVEAELACLNGQRETVVSGPTSSIENVARLAKARGIVSQALRVSHAFHSQMMAGAADALGPAVRTGEPSKVARSVASTVTGSLLGRDADVVSLLVEQLTSPVRFSEAAIHFAQGCDFAVEVGPGSSMSRLIEAHGVPSASLDVFALSCAPALECLGRLHVAGASLDFSRLFPASAYREPREATPTFLVSPCGVDAAATVVPAIPVPHAIALDGEVGGETCIAQLTTLVAEKTGLAPDSIDPDHRFLDDLHLNSLAVSRILSRLAQHRGVALPGQRTAFSNASLSEVAAEIEQLEASGGPRKVERIEGVARWVRRFRPVWREPEAGPVDMFEWTEITLGDPVPPECAALAIRIGQWGGERDVLPLMQAVRDASGACRHLALLHHRAPLSGFVRTLAAEGIFDTVRAVDCSECDGALPGLPSRAPVVALGSDGAPLCAGLTLDEEEYPFGATPEVIVVTGGAKGIGAEVAIELAKRTQAALVLVGRSSPTNADVTRTLARTNELGLRAGYAQAAVEDADALSAGLAPWIAEFGSPTHLIHAAGVNNPASFADIPDELIERTMAPKVRGLRNAIAACGPGLGRIVTFGSIIGRLGLQGEAHYALANAEQSRLLEEIAKENDALSTLDIEWSVWAGAGMGDRLGVIDQLGSEGIDAIPLEDAIAQACDLVLSDAEGSLLVTSRFASDAAVPGVGTLRFLDMPLIYTPGVELVCETTLNHGRDPYLLSHQVDGVPVMPGVMLIEAMAQVAGQLADGAARAVIERVEFLAAVTVGIEGRRIRVAALREPDGTVACEVRTDEDGFVERVVRATCKCGDASLSEEPNVVGADLPATALYGPLFFHEGAFARVAAIGGVSSRTLEATLRSTGDNRLFGAFEPQTTVFGDPILRDCGLHVLQVCVPHRRVLPVRAERIERGEGGSPVAIAAREIWARGGDYAFDIEWRDEQGRTVERWHEAVFREVGPIAIEPTLAAMPALLRPYLERLARGTTGDDSLRCSLVIDPAMERERRRAAALGALGLDSAVDHRGDGTPLFPDGVHCSLSHTEAATLAVRCDRPIGCDLVSVAEFAQDVEAAHWAASESLRKIGVVGNIHTVGGSAFRVHSGECAMVLPPLDVAGAPHLASLAFAREAHT